MWESLKNILGFSLGGKNAGYLVIGKYSQFSSYQV